MRTNLVVNPKQPRSSPKAIEESVVSRVWLHRLRKIPSRLRARLQPCRKYSVLQWALAPEVRFLFRKALLPQPVQPCDSTLFNTALQAAEKGNVLLVRRERSSWPCEKIQQNTTGFSPGLPFASHNMPFPHRFKRAASGSFIAPETK